jgi:uncharacterized protein
VDVLRGYAVLGILVMNIQSFAMVGAAYMNPTVTGSLEGIEYWIWLLSHVLADQKFMTIFSMLFGAGIMMMSERQKSKSQPAVGLHYRRMVWLLVIGLLHAYLLWYGDILVAYAMCGTVVFLFRRLPPWLLVTLGIVSLAVPSAISLLSGASMPYWPKEEVRQLELEHWSPTAEQMEHEVATYRGSWIEQMPHRTEAAFVMETFVFLILFAWRAGGLMLIGMAFWKWNVLTGRRSTGIYATFLVAGLLGIPLILYGVHRNFAADWSVTYSFFQGGQFNYWGSLLVSLGYVGCVMIACQKPGLAAMLTPLAAVGRMALTNYLLHTIICTSIFYGHGLGQFGSFSRVEQLVLVVAICVFQLVASPIWLRYFRFGPLEWLWRSLSYWKLQPMLREHAVSPATD